MESRNFNSLFYCILAGKKLRKTDPMSDKPEFSILLVEDDDIDILNVQRVFKKMNYPNPLHVAHNGVEALDMLRGTNGATKLSPTPKIILLDINMPLMNGIEFIFELRRLNGGGSPKVVFCTTENDVAHIARALHAGANEYIMKPFDKDIVTAKFQEVGLL